MSRRFGALFLHGSAAAIMAYGFTSLQHLPIDEWISKQKGGHLQYLTIQGLALAWFTMTLSFMMDVLPPSSILRSVKRTLLMVSLPLAIVVSAVYWSLLLLFPSLILQRKLESEPSSSSQVPEIIRIPLNIDLALHAVPALTLLVDFLFLERKYTKGQVRFGAPLAVIVSGTWYACWVEYCASYNGFFPYPFLTENTFGVRIGIYTTVSLIALFSFKLINALHPTKSKSKTTKRA